MRILWTFLVSCCYSSSCFAQQIFSDDAVRISAFTSAHQYIDLGMSGVAVLDQGVNHNCGFFAPIAVLDAIIVEHAMSNKSSDSIDPMCVISSGMSVIEAANSALLVKNGQCRNPKLPHSDVIDWRYSQQNLLTYPATDYQKSFPKLLEKDDLSSLAEIYPVTVAGQLINLREYQLTDHSNDNTKTLANIKNELKNGHRVLFVTALLYVTAHEEQDDSDSGQDYGVFHLYLNQRDAGYSLYSCHEAVSAVDNCMIYHEIMASGEPYKGKKIAQHQYIHIAAHEMIFTAYDANAQLFKIRNSHGNDRGDNGDFYMAEDYARNMLFGASVIK